MTRALLLGLAATAAACEGVLPSPDFERMQRQPRGDVYEETDLFADGRVMRPPPLGTVPRERPAGDPLELRGYEGGRYATRIPVPATRALLARGRDRYDIFCAACHGLAGDGRSAVADRMELRKPPSLLDRVARALPPGRVYQVVTEGYGLMPAYDHQLSVADRWAVVAYLGALQLSQGVALEALPPAIREEARRALEGAR